MKYKKELGFYKSTLRRSGDNTANQQRIRLGYSLIDRMGIVTTSVTRSSSMCRTTSTQNDDDDDDLDTELTILADAIEMLESVRDDLFSQLASSERETHLLEAENEARRDFLDRTRQQLQQEQALNDEITEEIEDLRRTTGPVDPKTYP